MDNTKNYIEVQAEHLLENRVYDWRSDGAPYVVEGDVEVWENSINSENLSTLKIHPGTVVMFADGDEFLIGHNSDDRYIGALQADGATFTRLSDGYLWPGIDIRCRSEDEETYLDDCIIEYAADGVHCASSNPTLTNNIFRNNQDGLEIEAGGYPVIENNQFSSNDKGIRKFTGSEQLVIGGSPSAGNTFIGNTTAGIEEINGNSRVDTNHNYWYSTSGTSVYRCSTNTTS